MQILVREDAANQPQAAPSPAAPGHVTTLFITLACTVFLSVRPIASRTHLCRMDCIIGSEWTSLFTFDVIHMSLHCVSDYVCCIHLIQLKSGLIYEYALQEIMSENKCLPH